MSKEAILEEIIEEYGVDVESTKPVEVDGLKPTTKVFRVDRADLIDELYIVDTMEAKAIACHPHLVGEALEPLCRVAALEAAKAMWRLTDIGETDNDSLVFEHVLRAAPGYRLREAFQALNADKKIREVWVRPRYSVPSYRDHDEEAFRDLRIVYEDFEELPQNREVVVLKPDTEATGRSGQMSIERVVEACEEVGSKVREVVLYGFISIPGLRHLKKTARKHGVKLIAFAMGNLTHLAHNGYDMTLYGVDESLWEERSRIRKLGSIVDRSTLERYVDEFVPGSDQPGDWSARQRFLHITKTEMEPGEIRKHLENSIRLIETLRKISGYEPWQDHIADRELSLLEVTLRRL